MAKGQLPKAYLRIDPNLDQTHPDPGAFVRLLCAAARQPKRGRFKNRDLAEAALSRKAVATFLDRHDLVERETGQLEVDGWDIWQEGDMTVGERVRKFRERHLPAIAVTEPLHVTPDLPLPPSEASRQQGVRRQASGDRNGVEGSGKAAVVVGREAARLGLPGEDRPLRDQIKALLALLAQDTGKGQDELLYEASLVTGTTKAIVNVEGCQSVPWLRTTLDRLKNMSMAHRKAALATLEPPPLSPLTLHNRRALGLDKDGEN